ncbi:MAG: Bifunctional protein BirA [Planctomycetota bacterium]|jgi:BirA family biotin operon repressor/biotin-[acetyl-CoA-carboxylase] ligase
MPPAPFDLPRLLRESSLQHIEYHPTLDSTSTLAAELLEPLLNCAPALVLTAEQTAGRGRKGNAWWSAAGALAFTLVLRGDELPLPAARRPLLAICTGLAVRKALATFAPTAALSIKWPNDVLSDSRKICGILVEQQGSATAPGLLLGIGINVNNSTTDAPPEIAARAISLSDLTGSPSDLTEVLLRILQELDAAVAELSRRPAALLAEVNRHSLLNGRHVTVRSGDTDIAGLCLGIDEDGCLVLQHHSGIARCTTGVVQEW